MQNQMPTSILTGKSKRAVAFGVLVVARLVRFRLLDNDDKLYDDGLL